MKRRFIYILLLPLVLLLMGYILVSNEIELLWRAQEMNLWLPTAHFWETCMQYPGGVATWLATYFTQFFFYPWFGTGILLAMWLVICLALVYVYRLKGPWVLLALLIPAALLACIVQTGYWVYYQKLPGHLFVPTIGVLFASTCLIVQRSISCKWGKFTWIVLVGCLGYPFFGAWGLGACALCGFLALGPHISYQCIGPSLTPQRVDAKSIGIKFYKFTAFNFQVSSKALLPLLVAFALVAIVPQICYQHFFDETMRDYLYRAAFPSLRCSTDSFEQYRWAYYAIVVGFVVLIIVSRFRTFFNERLRMYLQIPIVVVLLIAAGVGVKSVWYHDANFQKELAMTRAVEDDEWERVLVIARDGSSAVKPTRLMVVLKNLALFRLGRAGDEMFTYPEGSTQQNAPWTIHMPQVGGKLLYYHFGKENFCYRWCMEDGVEFGWKVETLKLMTRVSLLNKEWTVARKYLELLKKTTFHRAWAEHYEKILSKPESMDLQTLEQSVKDGKPLLEKKDLDHFLPIMHLMGYRDRLDGDNTLVEMYLLSTFSHGYGSDIYFQELTLICAMIMKDIQLFWPRFVLYARLHPDKVMPRHYQEAAYLYGHLENKVDITKMPFSKDVVDSYERFMKFNEQCGPMTEEQKAVAFYPLFGNTFYYFYFLVRHQKTN